MSRRRDADSSRAQLPWPDVAQAPQSLRCGGAGFESAESAEFTAIRVDSRKDDLLQGREDLVRVIRRHG
jgi:hypothetical protein